MGYIYLTSFLLKGKEPLPRVGSGHHMNIATLPKESMRGKILGFLCCHESLFVAFVWIPWTTTTSLSHAIHLGAGLKHAQVATGPYVSS